MGEESRGVCLSEHRALLGHGGKCTETPGNNYTWSQFCCKKQNELFMNRERKGASRFPRACGAQERIKKMKEMGGKDPHCNLQFFSIALALLSSTFLHIKVLCVLLIRPLVYTYPIYPRALLLTLSHHKKLSNIFVSPPTMLSSISIPAGFSNSSSSRASLSSWRSSLAAEVWS